MKRFRFLFYVGLMLTMFLGACAPASTPTPTTVPATNTSAPPAAADTSAPAATSTTAPVSLAGPEMKVGSTFLYFDGATLVAVPAGPFLMGHGGSDNPEHTVTLSDYWIYATKITNRQFAQCVAVGKCTAPDEQINQGYTDPKQEDFPVVGVNWAQGEAYCEYANGKLPTEAQWEKAARGPDGNIYPWGENAPTANLLNFNNNVGSASNVVDYPQGKSFYDALDMEGNVYEWVYDWYDPLYYRSGPAQDPQGPDKGVGGQRSVRSAGYKSNNDQVVASVRFYKLPLNPARDLGFRCVVKNPTFFAPACQLTSYIGTNLGGNPGASSGSACQPPIINKSDPDCQQTIGVVTVDAGTGDTNLQATGTGGCTATAPGSHAAKFSCPSAGSVNVTYTCGSGQLSQSCPLHYNLQGNTCVWDGSGTAGQACPTGQQYNPTQMCCMSAPGTGTDFSACPPGTTVQDLGGGNYACVQNGAQGAPQSASVKVSDPPTTAQCTSGPMVCGGLTCGTNYKLDPKTCTCVCNGC